MKFIIQEIIVEWNKKYRGAPFSSKRSNLATAYLLPQNPSNQNDVVLLHSIFITQTDNDFVIKNKPFQILEFQREIKRGCIRIVLSQAKTEAFFEYNYDMGAPARHDYKGNLLKEKSFTLNPNESGQIIYNGRLSLEGDWLYQKKCFNVIYTENFQNTLFLQKSPLKKYQQLAMLR